MKVIKRHRSIKSCKYCYEHKLKCNKQSPCDNCTRLGITSHCVYGFKRSGESSVPTNVGKRTTKPEQKTKTLTTPLPKPYYPYLAEAETGNLLNVQDATSNTWMKRNAIANFKKCGKGFMTAEEVNALIPANRATTCLVADTYFQKIDPIIPILHRAHVFQKIDSAYTQKRLKNTICISEYLIIFAILFSVAYSNVAEGQIPDLLLCDKYYSAFQALLNLSQFPYNPSLAAIQGLLITNFVVDPNMVETLGISATLLRHGEQLKIGKPDMLTEDGTQHPQLAVLWHFLLYFEGSSAVVAGIPFISTAQMVESVDLPELTEGASLCKLAFAYGRFYINNLFRRIMQYKDTGKAPSEPTLRRLEVELTALKSKVELLCLHIEKSNKELATYFALTDSVHSPSSKPKTIHDLLNSDKVLSESTVELSIALLFYTLRRLLVNDSWRYAWYSKGSTVMQYLFILIKDIHQNPDALYDLTAISHKIPVVLSDDIVECMKISSNITKFVLVEELIKLLETRVAPLWGDDDLKRFIVIRSMKETVWASGVAHRLSDQSQLRKVYECSLFRVCQSSIETSSSFNLEECMKQWELDRITFDSEKIMNWLSDF